MATTGSERGLTLRSPGPVPRHRRAARSTCYRARTPPSPACASGSTEAWMRAEAYQPVHPATTVTRLAGGAVAGAESSLNKMWWSELDVGCTRSPSTCSAPRPKPRGRGRRAASSRCRARSTPAPTRSSATSSPSACSACRGSRSGSVRFAFTDDQLAFRDAVRDLLAKECPPDGRARRVGRARRRPRPGCVGPAGRDGRPGDARARGRRRAGPRRARPGPRARGGRPGGPARTRSSRPRRWPRRWSRRRRGRRSGPPACPTPTGSAWWRPISAGPTWPARPTPTGCCCGPRDRRAAPGRPGGHRAHARRHGRRRPPGRHRRTGSRRPTSLVTDDPAAVALAPRPGRARDRRPARRPRPADARPHRRLRERAPAVRRADRVVPGGEAPPGRRPLALGLRPARRVPGGLLAGDRRRHPGAGRVDGQGHGVGRRRGSSAAGRSSATAPSATPSSTTCTCT